MAAYDDFAWFYNRYWGRDYPRNALPILERLLLAQLPARAKILDLCCGTGHLTLILSERGYRVVGIDGSAEMLRYARENVPGGEFIPEDARSFHVLESFDGIVSTFESLNHVMHLREIKDVFRNVHAALDEGGVFVFDLLMEEAYRTQWDKSSAIVEDDKVTFAKGFGVRKLGAPVPPPTPQAPPAPPADQVFRMPIVYSIPGMDRVTVRRDVVYKTVDSSGAKLELKMDAYIPANAQPGQKFPAVLLISGGGADPAMDWRVAGVYQSYGRLLAGAV